MNLEAPAASGKHRAPRARSSAALARVCERRRAAGRRCRNAGHPLSRFKSAG